MRVRYNTISFVMWPEQVTLYLVFQWRRWFPKGADSARQVRHGRWAPSAVRMGNGSTEPISISKTGGMGVAD